jgi:hypothetical protein
VSTNINITVGDDALLNRVKQQQSANRQAQLEREASARLEAQATAARTTALTAAGKDAAGNPLIGTRLEVPQLERRPAATRQGGSGFNLIPSADYTSFGFEALTRGIKATTFTNIIASAVGSYATYFRPEYVATGGPANSSYLRTPVESRGAIYFHEINYCVCNTPGTQGIRFSKPIRILTSSGEVTAQQISKPLHKLTSYTVECYLQAAPEGPVSGLTNVLCDTDFDVTVNPISGSLVRLVTGFLVFNSVGVNANTFSLELRGANQVAKVNVYFGYNPSIKPPGSYIWPTTLNFGGWYHVAYVRNNNVESFYFEGQLVATKTSDLSFVSAIPDSALTTASIQFLTGEFGVVANPILRPGIHGFRFTSKALYNGNFVPPPQITTLG